MLEDNASLTVHFYKNKLNRQSQNRRVSIEIPWKTLDILIGMRAALQRFVLNVVSVLLYIPRPAQCIINWRKPPVLWTSMDLNKL